MCVCVCPSRRGERSTVRCQRRCGVAAALTRAVRALMYARSRRVSLCSWTRGRSSAEVWRRTVEAVAFAGGCTTLCLACSRARRRGVRGTWPARRAAGCFTCARGIVALQRGRCPYGCKGKGVQGTAPHQSVSARRHAARRRGRLTRRGRDTLHQSYLGQRVHCVDALDALNVDAWYACLHYGPA